MGIDHISDLFDSEESAIFSINLDHDRVDLWDLQKPQNK